MFFIILKGTLGKEVFLIDIEGFDSITHSFDNDKIYKFLAYDPNDLETVSFVVRKHGTIFGYEVRAEKEMEKKK